MSKLFSRDLLEKLQCSEEQMNTAKKYGEKFTYEEFGKECVCYLYKGKYHIYSIEDK